MYIKINYDILCHLVMTNIAMANPEHTWRVIAGKIIYQWAIYTMAMLNNQRVYNGVYTYIYIYNLVGG